MPKKEEGPEYIAQHKKLYHHATRLIDTAAHTHSEAYLKAVEEHLMEDGQVNFEKLDDAKVQKQFIKSMSEMYTSKAKQHFKVAKDLDDLEKDILMQAYVGVTGAQIRGIVTQYGKRLTHGQFDQLKSQLQRGVSERMYAAAGSHLEQEHIPQIVKHLGLEERVDAAKVTLEEARELLDAFHREGSVSDTVLREHVPRYKWKKEEKAEKKAA